MEDSSIVELYWTRAEAAIAETAKKYGRYCHAIAYNVLYDNEDADETVNDTYLDAWNSMPPHRPGILATFLGKITRRLSIDRLRSKLARKRGGGEVQVSLDELGACICSCSSIEETIELRELSETVNCFLSRLSAQERDVFVCRYWFLASIRDIAMQFDTSEGRIKTMLYRTRKKLHDYLRKEGY